MKLLKGSSILLIFLVSSLVCFGQEKSEANLVDRFGDLSCEDILSRIDYFMYLLSEDPKAQGYVVIYPEKDSIKRALRFERLINGSIYSRRFDKSRIILIRNKEDDAAMVELWKVPFGAEKPFFVEEKWVDVPIEKRKPFIFGSVFVDEVCPTFIPENYANLIKENPNLRGHIVVFNKSKKEAQIEMKEWLKIFTEEYKVPRNRLKIFFGRNEGMPDVEFWIVPRK